MKPRTANQREVLRLSHSLAPLSPANDVEARHLDGKVYVGKKEAWCSVCGHVFDSGDLWSNRRKKVAVCPHCGKAYRVERSANKRKCSDVFYYTMLEVKEGWQVVRNYWCSRLTKKGELLWWGATEVSQLWIKPGESTVAVARMAQTAYYDGWCCGTPMEVRTLSDRHFLCGYLGKGAHILPEYRKRGLTAEVLEDCCCGCAFEKAMANPKIEILAKAGQSKLLASYVGSYSRAYTIDKYWPSVRIACRHGFKVKDVNTWLDYLHMLDDKKKDLRSPHYVCNADFIREHDRILEKRRKDAERRRRLADRERARQEAMRNKARLDPNNPMNKEYRKRIGAKLLATVVMSKNRKIVLQPLQDICDFFQEYQALGHCVYTNAYYDGKKHPGSLIIGAKVDGKRTETIELDTRSMKIIQCQGEHNHNSKHHDAILRLMKANINKFKPVTAI